MGEEIGYREVIAWCTNQLGVVSRMQGRFELAARQQGDSLAVFTELGNRWRQASVLEELATLATRAGDPAGAGAHLAAADRLRREIGAPVPLAESGDRDETASVVGTRLGSLGLRLATASPAA